MHLGVLTGPGVGCVLAGPVLNMSEKIEDRRALGAPWEPPPGKGLVLDWGGGGQQHSTKHITTLESDDKSSIR